MVQRKVTNKLGIKLDLVIPQTQLLNLRSPSPQPHDLKKKKMKKSRPVKRSDLDNFRSSPPFATETTQKRKRSPNYMKSTSSFDARKERCKVSPLPFSDKTPSKNISNKSTKTHSSSLKLVRSLTKTTSFKPLRPSKKCSSMALCENLDAQRATCSSTLKDSKFPSYLQLSPGGTELEGTSAMKVCPYTYCSLNGHHHAPVPPLKCFISAKRRALKTQKSFKIGCLSPRQKKPVAKKNEELVYGEAPVEDVKGPPLVEEDSGDGVQEELVLEKGVERLYGGLQGLHDEESVSSGAWLEDGDSESDGSYQTDDKKVSNFDAFEDSKNIIEAYQNNIIDYQQPENPQEEESRVPENQEKPYTKIYNIIQNIHISILVVGENTKHSETERPETADVADINDEEMVDTNQDSELTNDDDDKNKINEVRIDNHCKTSKDQSDAINNQLSFMGSGDHKKTDIEMGATNETSESTNEGRADDDDDDDKNKINEVPIDHTYCKTFKDQSDAINNQVSFMGSEDHDESVHLGHQETKKVNKIDAEKEDSSEFNPRGPNFLPLKPDPDAETVDLRHQMMDERKNAEEWMVDFALRQKVSTLGAGRKRRVALLVEAFEKVMPMPKYEPHFRHASQGFALARPMQACS